MALISQILGIFGSGLGSIFTWAIGLWQTHVANEKAASDQMNSDINAHAGDGALSVGDRDSALDQITQLEQKAKDLDNPSPGGTHA